MERIGGVRILRGGPGWSGLALRLARTCGEGELFQLAMTAGDGRSIAVATLHADEVVAAWRAIGQVSGLALLLETPDGTVSSPYPQIGRLALGAVRQRRRYALLAGRRPRFLARRKVARLSDRPVIVRGVALFD